MFVTDENHKHPLSSALGGDGFGIWQAVEVKLYQPWFVIEFELPCEDEDDSHHARTMLSSRIDDVLRLAQLTAEGGLLLKSVALMSPHAYNRTASWQMDPLIAIWEADEPSDPRVQARIFEKVNGDFFVDSIFCSTVDLLDGWRQLAVLPSSATDKAPSPLQRRHR